MVPLCSKTAWQFLKKKKERKNTHVITTIQFSTYVHLSQRDKNTCLHKNQYMQFTPL